MPTLDWLNRANAFTLSARVPYRLLDPVSVHGDAAGQANNLLIQGDNLEHAQWLCMMLPRLQLLRELLREDGSIWVTIDDNEGHYLKVLMDEVFGRGNFVANVVWQKVFSPKNTARHFSEDHDHVLVFAKNGNLWTPNDMPRPEKLNAS
ncbi:MAG: site-specific DNA-methyltransferase, partial [Polaromonas sp.]